MISTFYGFETGRSALQASQLGLSVTGQNTANANTEDYTRQVLDVTAVNKNSGAGQFIQPKSSNIGQGVSVTGVSQTRDRFLDSEVRTANSNYGAWDTRFSALKDIENVLDESMTDGLHAMLGDFYDKLQKLSNNVGIDEYTSLTRSGAEKVTQVLNQYSTQLGRIRKEYESSLSLVVSDINKTVTELNKVNESIKDQALRGSISNELLDLRNGYLDTLSGYMGITVSTNPDATVSVISTGDVNVLDSKFSVTKDGGTTKVIRTDSTGDNDFVPISGNVSSYLNILNSAGVYDSDNSFKGISYYEKALNDFTKSFVETFNSINSTGGADKPLFEGITADKVRISSQWRESADFIVTSVNGANDNVEKMINAMDQKRAVSPYFTGTLGGFSKSLMNDIAEDTSYHSDIRDMSGNILESAFDQRKSITGVSTNEESMNMIKYQKAFQAASRFITTLDEMLDTLITRTGIVGR